MTILKWFNDWPFNFTFICPYLGFSYVQFNCLASWWEFCDKNPGDVECVGIFLSYPITWKTRTENNQLHQPIYLRGYLKSSTDCNQIRRTGACLITMHMLNVIQHQKLQVFFIQLFQQANQGKQTNLFTGPWYWMRGFPVTLYLMCLVTLEILSKLFTDEFIMWQILIGTCLVPYKYLSLPYDLSPAKNPQPHCMHVLVYIRISAAQFWAV